MGPLWARGTRTSDPGRAGAPGTLLQSRRPSRQRQLLQSSTQELPCGKGMPCDQQGLPNTTTVGTAEGSAMELRPGGQFSPCPCPARAPPTLLTPWAGPAGRAAAAIAIDLIHTRGPVCAGGRLALVNVCREGADSAGSRGHAPMQGLVHSPEQQQRPVRVRGDIWVGRGLPLPHGASEPGLALPLA